MRLSILRKSGFAAIAACILLTPAAQAVGQCEKPTAITIPADAASLSLESLQALRTEADAYMTSARDYLACLDQIIYTTVPEDPIVSKAGQAHQDYALEWGAVWGNVNMACVNWEVEHSSQFPGGCAPEIPTSG